MTRLIDADALIETIVETAKDLRTLSTKTIGEAIHKTPTIDAVPVIRCKDCKHYDKFIRQNIGQGWCDVAAWRGRYMGDNDYCSRAERKESS